MIDKSCIVYKSDCSLSIDSILFLIRFNASQYIFFFATAPFFQSAKWNLSNIPHVFFRKISEDNGGAILADMFDSAGSV